MSRRAKYRIIAAFLLTVFSLNTVAGFACSIGMDLGYNKSHHEHEVQLSHQDGEHVHQILHQHDNPTIAAVNASRQNDDCCTNEVTSFTKLDKSIVDHKLALQTPVFLLALTSAFILQDIKEVDLATTPGFQFVRRSSFLNDTDIRIAIQSFQI